MVRSEPCWPGGWIPASQPLTEQPTGSLSVHHMEQCGASTSIVLRQKATKLCTFARFSHPPLSTNQPGSVKCRSVTHGSMPLARSSRHQSQ